MNKLLTQASIATMASIFLVSNPAFASDLNRPGSLKDDVVSEVRSSNHSGIYINGALGLARGDRDLHQRIDTSKNYLYETNAAGEVVGDASGSEATNLSEAACVAKADTAKCDPSSWSPDLASDLAPTTPNALGDTIYTDSLSMLFNDDVDATVFGGGISYLYHIPRSRYGIEIGVDGTFYTDNETNFDFKDERGRITHSDGGLDDVYDLDPEDGLNDHVAHTGVTSFERDYDIDLVLKGHLFVNDRLSVYAGGGLSWAQASLKTAHATGYDIGGGAEGVFDNAFSDDSSSFGYVLVAGGQYWLSDAIVLGLEYSYKNHEFDFDRAKSTDAQYNDGDTVYRYGVSDDITVEDEVHAIKAKLGIKLN